MLYTPPKKSDTIWGALQFNIAFFIVLNPVVVIARKNVAVNSHQLQRAELLNKILNCKSHPLDEPFLPY